MIYTAIRGRFTQLREFLCENNESEESLTGEGELHLGCYKYFNILSTVSLKLIYRTPAENNRTHKINYHRRVVYPIGEG